MLKTSLIALAAVAAFLSIAPQASAQTGIWIPPSGVAPGSVRASYPRGYSTPVGGSFFVQGDVTPRFPYSYWAAFPNPAREYVGYGFNDFPFYGDPYGKPTDRWSWQYMSGAGSGMR
jgi:hypothetical protein